MLAISLCLLPLALAICQDCDTEVVNLLTWHRGHRASRHHRGGHYDGRKHFRRQGGDRGRKHTKRRRRGGGGGGNNDDTPSVDTSDSGYVPCTYNKTYGYPDGVVQVALDSTGTPLTELDSRCSSNAVSYVDDSEEASCILNSPGDYYDYGNWDAESACPYPAGATEYPTVTTRAQCEAYYNNFVALGDSITINGTYYKLGIGHGPLKGVRGNCYFMEYEGRYALIFQVDIRSWSFEFTYDTLQYIYNNQGDPGGTCLIPNVQIIDCADIPGMS
ncbi:unnamed protein product [Durusdinium trenchii]|uniref:Uncharacterized protein n=1 Tax=Durusdinium trenchii TaxID=1381693 RepID=A0ABP0KIY0_9DINO